MVKKKEWLRLTNSLYNRHDIESGVYAIFKTSSCINSKKLLVTQVIIPEDKDYHKRSAARVAFTPEFTEKAFKICEANRGHLMDIHTHPWSGNVNFSPVDDREAIKTKLPYMNRYLPETLIAFIVFGSNENIAKARFWDKEKNRLLDINRIVVI